MAQNGDVTISNLKTATGISSNDLSDHHPSGPGVQTKMGFWFIDGLDTSNIINSGPPPEALFDERDVPSDIIEGDEFSLWVGPKGSNVKITNSRGDEAVIQGTIDNGGLVQTVNLDRMQINEINFDKTIPGETVKGIELVVECTDAGSLSVVVEWDDGGYNSDTIGYQSIRYSFSDQGYSQVNVFVTSVSEVGGDVEIDYTIQDGTDPYDVEINRSDDGGQTYTNIANFSRSSAGSYTYEDNGANTSQSYIYEIIVTDDRGSQDTDGGVYVP